MMSFGVINVNSKHQAGTYLFKVINGNSKNMCKVCSKLTTKSTERSQWRCFGVFIGNIELISHTSLADNIFI